MVRKHVIYSGRVQGVGFRYTTVTLARRHPVTGYVRNLPDGTVELEVQGEPEAVEALLADVAREFEGYIRDVQVRDVPLREGEDGFEIRY